MPVSEVAQPSVGYEAMAKKWPMLDDLLSGTQAMRDAGETWLPKEPGESFTKYEARLNRSTLYAAYSDTIDKLSNKPFSRPMSVSNLPEALDYLLEDVDSTGMSLETFAQDILMNLLVHGVVHVFVDHSVVEAVANGGKATKADEEREGARVLLTVVPAPRLIGWQTELRGREIKLTQIRMVETKLEPTGKYGDVQRNYIRVVTETGWELHQQKDDQKDEYVSVGSGNHTFGSVPLVSIYAERTGFLTANPPLENLAWMNITHWQSSSDQRNILRFSRFSILFGKGMGHDVVEKGEIEIGPSRSIVTSSVDAELKYVEHTGKGLEAGQKDLEDLEQKMEVLGNLPMLKQPKKLATSVRIDSDRTSSQLQCWIRNVEHGIIDVLKMACQWRKIEAPDDLSVDIFSDFETALLGSTDLDWLLKVRQAGEITRETFLREVKRRGRLADGVDVDEEIERLNAEAGAELAQFADALGEEEDDESKDNLPSDKD